MSAIDWPATQRALGVTADGIAGKNTYAALLGVVASSSAAAEVIASIANAAIVHFGAYGIDASPDRLADFLAQTANETGGYTVFEENLNYSAERMLEIWPSHFTPEQAEAAEGDPVEIASRAYGGRMGNDPYPSTDGYDYRGRGMLQLTGKSNYQATDKRVGCGLDINPDGAAFPALSCEIACDFYRSYGVLDALDDGDTTKAREITNGGTIGLDNVNALRAKLIPGIIKAK